MVTTGPVLDEASASAALDAVQRSPRDAIEIGLRAAGKARGSGDADEHATAERAIGLAFRELNDFDNSLRHLRRAVRIADRDGSPRVAALTRLSLAYVQSNTGHNAQALHTIDAALPWLHGVDAGRARMQRGVVLHYSGRYREAALDYTAAIEVARRHGDLIGEAKALNNRGLLQAYRGAPAGAEDDCERAAEIFTGLDLELAAADVRWNSGIAAAQRGDVPRALEIFAQVDAEYRRLDVPRPALLLDRIELLLSVPLIDEAQAVAAAAVEELRSRGMASDAAEAQLALARVALLAGDLDRAAASAAGARATFQRQRRHTWAAFARHVELRASFLAGTRSPTLLAATARTAGVLDAVGWSAPALTARIEAARIAHRLGRPGAARRQLATARESRRGGTAAQRAQGWYAEALLRRMDGDDRGARNALRRGLAVLDDYRVSLGATELRAHTGAQGEALAREGLAIALRDGRAAEVLAWAERWRAGALRMTPALPPEDPRLEAALTELRAVSSDLREAVLDGRRNAALLRRQAQLEQEIRDYTRRASGGGSVDRPPTVGQLASQLGEAALVEFVLHDGRLVAVVARDGRATMHAAGTGDDAVRYINFLRFALHRISLFSGRADTGAAAQAAAMYARHLDEQLLGPVRARIDHRPLVVVPTGALNSVPWSVLPACRARPVTVAPSAAVWLRAASARGSVDGHPVLTAGPGVPAAPLEVESLSSSIPGARVLLGSGATVAAVAAAWDGAPLAHVAAHGTFRADNPLFSSLELADGPLTVYDLEHLRRPPERIVLSACDSGLSAVRPGDELMGLTAALLGLGTRTLVATVVPVPDGATTPLMLDLHQRMRAGLRPAEALAAAQEAYSGGGEAAYVASAGFVCFGAG